MTRTAQTKSSILLVGGGSGGHFYPLIAIAEALRANPLGLRLYYAGPDRYDADALSANNISFVHIPAGKRRKYASVQNVIDAFKTLFGITVAVVKLYFIYPDIVVSKGGYTSVPVVLAARFLRIPIVIHESDAVMGSANKLALRGARAVIVAYDELRTSVSHPQVYQFGIPIRNAFFQPYTGEIIKKYAIDSTRPLILIIGGSQGAERVNTLILDALDNLLSDFSVLHQTGIQNFEVCKLAAQRLISDQSLQQHYHPVPFLSQTELNDAYHAAGIIISRAGSNSIYEIALHGKPSILIPIPEEISHDQRTNAYAYARAGGGVVLEEKNLSGGLLRSEIDRIMQDPDLYNTMSQSAQAFAKKDTATRIATILTKIVQEH